MKIYTPISDALKKYSAMHRISFAMPGHKGRGIDKAFAKNIIKYDVTELCDTLDLHNPNEPVTKAKKAAADFFGAQDTFFLTGGSTSGIFAMLAATAKHGEKVAVNRACHISVINACIALGIEPVFITQSVIDGFSVPAAVNQKDLIDVLDANPDTKAVLITSPSYYGICSDIETLAKITRARGIPLLVDEAHGAHFAVNPTLFPRTAMSQGADLAVQSAHKTLNALNQTAYLHIGGDIVDKARVFETVKMFQTSSPSYPSLATADTARAELESSVGRGRWKTVLSNCEKLRNSVSQKTKVEFMSMLYNGKYNIDSVDETRIVMNFAAYKTSGFDISKKLRTEYGIDVEMADLFNVVAIATASNTARDFSALSSAVVKICADLEPSEDEPTFPPVPIPTDSILPKDAFYAKTRTVRLDEAVGCYSASTVFAYPPAVPIICIGEKVSEDSAAYIEALKSLGAQIVGLNANGYIKIVDNDF